MDAETRRLMDALEMAWGVIANASGGNWENESPEWQEAAARWRDEHWHPALDRNGYTPREAAPLDRESEPEEPGKIIDDWPCRKCGGAKVRQEDIGDGVYEDYRFTCLAPECGHRWIEEGADS